MSGPKEGGALPDGWWPCACVKRNRRGQMTHFAAHPPTQKRCSRCSMTREGDYEPTDAERDAKERRYRRNVGREGSV
jgi:hypothetical protein